MVKAREALDAAMSEAELQRTVIEMARLFGYRVAHFRPVNVRRRSGSEYWTTPMQGDVGFPDIVAARISDERLLFIECKSERGQLSEEQKQWLFVLDGAGGEDGTPYGAKVYVWRPSSLSSGLIERVLRGGTE